MVNNKKISDEFVEMLLARLNEIQAMEETLEQRDNFLLGEKTALVECLEIMQSLDVECVYGLDEDLEETFPI